MSSSVFVFTLKVNTLSFKNPNVYIVEIDIKREVSEIFISPSLKSYIVVFHN